MISTIVFADTIPQTQLLDSNVQVECNYLVLKNGKENKIGLSYLTGVVSGVQTDKIYNNIRVQESEHYLFPIYQACIYGLRSKRVKQKEILFIDVVTKKLIEILNNEQSTPSLNRSL